ncbi:hypothetical protein K1T71_006060 [Dendrolimus kikuchii]|uniref:Uncharacterized protein n=1 Tax=Dendrolimus kikuchii TaxID=765133 RepID=A0ACC1D4B3_9NEOP|nr:hypothetical protein K1T71_006060 [Dendrolimus kikuchii]
MVAPFFGRTGHYATIVLEDQKSVTAEWYTKKCRKNNICIVKGRVCPEHRVRSKAYSVTLTINEKSRKIQDVQCHDCSFNGCKHALALLMWTHRRSEDPTPTEVACIATVIKYTEAEKLSKKTSNAPVENFQDNSTFLREVIEFAKNQQINSQIGQLNFDLKCKKAYNSSLHRLILDFNQSTDLRDEKFMEFAKTEMAEAVCKEAEQPTKQQSECAIWHELRYGRITASKFYEAAHCKTSNGSLVQQIIGASKVYETSAMTRGKQAQITRPGMYLLPSHPIFAASPDGMTSNAIVEVKCPSSHKSLDTFLPNGKVSLKCNAQMQLQMLLTGKKEGIFCVANPHFEENETIYIKKLKYDDAHTQALIKNSQVFWSKNIFLKLLKSVQT